MPIKIESVKTDGFTMEYFRFGKGKRTLAVIPGLSVRSVMHSADAIAREYDAMAEDFTVYVFDRRRELPPVYSIREMARDTAAVFRALGLKDICLFGASQGGMISQVIAIEDPDLISRLALGSTTPHLHPEQFRKIENWIDLAKKKDREGLYLSFGREIYPPEMFNKCRDKLAERSAEVTDEDLARFVILAQTVDDFDVTEELSRIKCPVLAIGAFEDSVVDSDATMEIAEKLEGRVDLSLYMYIGFGHASFDTAPDYQERLYKFFMGEADTI